MSASTAPRTGQPVRTQEHLCYCPGAVEALTAARFELDQARRELQRKDANYRATEALKAATAECHEARQLLQRLTKSPELDGQARELISKLEAAMPMVDRIMDIVRMLDQSEVIWLKR